MAKIKLVEFELISLLSESKKIIEYLQKTGSAHIVNIDNEELIKYKTESIVDSFDKKISSAEKACSIIEKHKSDTKKSVFSIYDIKKIEYSDFKLLADKSETLLKKINRIISLDAEIEVYDRRIAEIKAKIETYEPWINLDIPMSSRRTLTTDIFIGTFSQCYSREEIIELIKRVDESLDDIEVQLISSEKLLSCVLFMCHRNSADKLQSTFGDIGFSIFENPEPKLPKSIIEDLREDIFKAKEKKVFLEAQIKEFEKDYEDILFYTDYLSAQKDKYIAVENAASSDTVFYLKGYIPERNYEEIKFEIENNYIAQFEIRQVDNKDADVPVLIENRGFAAGVEGVTDMYSPVSNRDIDPNPIMSFFYYLFFGLMLSDGGYGILMIIFGFVLLKKFKVRDNLKRTANMVLFCGISATFWGALFGSWFGNLIPVIATEFLGYSTAPDLALWLDPMENSITLLLLSFALGLGHLLVGLLIKFFMLIRDKNYSSAIFDIIPVMVFVFGFAIFGAGFLTEIQPKIKTLGVRLLISGSLLILFTAGRSSKNIFGKIGLGLYGLYNTASGYLGDILSYSRLLALSLVTGVIATVINSLGAMTNNIVFFILVFILGHSINLAINLIGTYVHACRLQYVEFFSKFYEGGGRAFTPFKINSKHFTIKEDNKYG